MSKKVENDNTTNKIKSIEKKIKMLEKNRQENIKEISNLQYQINILEYETIRD